MGVRERGIVFYHWLVGLLGISFLLLTGGIWSLETIVVTILFTILAVSTLATKLEFDFGSVSLDLGVVLAALVTTGVPAALTVAATSYWLVDVLYRRVDSVTVFNSAQVVLAGLGAAIFYLRSGGSLPGDAIFLILPQMVFLTVYFFLNHSLVGLELLLRKPSISCSRYMSMIKWDLLATLLALPIGVSMIQMHKYLGLFGVALTIVPLITVSYALFLQQESKRYRASIDALHVATYEICAAFELQPTLDQILHQARNVAPFEMGQIYLCKNQTLISQINVASPGEEASVEEIKIGQGLVGLAAFRRQVVQMPMRTGKKAKGVAAECKIAVPLSLGEQTVGVLALSRAGCVFTKDEANNLSAIGGYAAIAIRNAQLYLEMTTLARTDCLTGLLTRRTLLKNLEMKVDRCRQHGWPLSVLMIDMDNFKAINDIGGHRTGDAVLTQITMCIREILSDDDIAARYGGDEIVVVLHGAGSQEAFCAAQQICQAVRDLPKEAEEPEFCTTVSIGIAGYPRHGDSADQLLFAADQAMYQAKRLGGNMVVSFSQVPPPKTTNDPKSGKLQCNPRIL